MLRNTFRVSFNTTVRQMTKMFQRKKTSYIPIPTKNLATLHFDFYGLVHFHPKQMY